jgi:hypothetical protein
MGLDGVLTEHHCHGIVDVRGRDVAVRVDILQSLNKSLFGIVDHCCFDMVPDTPTCECGRQPVETTLAQRRSAVTPSLVDGLTAEQIAAIKANVAAGTDREDSRADDWAGKAVAKVLGLDVVDKGQRAKAKITLTALTKSGHFKPEKRQSKSAKGRKCVHLAPADPAPVG